MSALEELEARVAKLERQADCTCAKCGVDIHNEYNYCPGCGQKIDVGYLPHRREGDDHG